MTKPSERPASAPVVPAPRTAWRAVSFVLALAAAGIAVAAAAAAPEASSDIVVRISIVFLWAWTGLGLATRRPAEPMAAVALLGALVAAAEAYGVAASGDLAAFVRWLALGAMTGVGAWLVVGLPDGRFARPSHRASVIVLAALGLAAGLASWLARPAPLWPVGIVAALGFAVTAAQSNARYRRSRGIDRQRMQWFGWAVSTGLTIAVVAVALRILVDWPDDPAIVAGIATALLPVSLVLGASSRMVAHVDRLLKHTVSIAGLAGLVAAIFVVVVLGLGRRPAETERTLLALSMAASAVAALMFPTMRSRLNDFAARLVYGEQHAPDEVLRTFGSRMSRAVPMDELLLQAAESLRKTFGLDAIEIWTGQAGSLERTVSLPERGKARMRIGAKELPVMARAGVTGRAWLEVWLPKVLEGREGSMVRLAPIAHQGEVLGAIVVERYKSADVFSEDEERVITDLARTIGVALHNVQLDSALQETLDEVRRQAEDLRASRERIVKAADDARRNIERDLHDGPQQHVVALAVKTKLIKTLLDADPDTAKGLLDELASDISEAVQRLRETAHGIFPPLLVDRGLSAALESVANKAALPTIVDADGIGRYPQEVETAVYFCTLEALTNAGKHAGDGATARVTVREENGVLRFEVADDGAGFDAGGKGLGMGFVNMKDRVGAAGGTLDVTSVPGQGTTITGRIPLAVTGPSISEQS